MNLVIIGNGFDLAHGLPTKYTDFHNYLEKTNPNCIDRLDLLFTFGEQWCDFENGLGHLKESAAQLVLKSYPGIHTTIKDEIQRAFASWVISLEEKNTATKKYELSKEDEYLSFNYTHTLHRSYEIDGKNIKYIHGCVGLGLFDYKQIIFGHKKCVVNSTTQSLLDATVKDVDNIITRNKDYFNSLSDKNIDTIKVFGHSYADVDFKYFEEIRKQLPHAMWEFGYLSDADKVNANAYMRSLHLSNGQAVLKESKCLFDHPSICLGCFKKRVR